MSKPLSPLKTKLCYHLGHILADISEARRGSLRLKVLKIYARILVETINLGRS